MAKKKFTNVWGSQSDIGKLFGISAIAVGKVLITERLKDKDTKAPTKVALDLGWAISTPLSTGEPFFMWNKAKVKELLKHRGEVKLSPLEVQIKDVALKLKEIDKMSNAGEDKLASLCLDTIFENVPKDLVKGVQDHFSAKGISL